MIRTIQVCERNIHVEPPRIINLSAATPTEVFPDETGTKEEIVARWIQNIGDTPIYISFGVSDGNGGPMCNDVDQYHTYIEGGQLFNCFPTRTKVCVYSADRTTVSTTKLVRTDMSH